MTTATTAASPAPLRPNLPERQTLTCREVGAILGIHEETVKRLVADGTIPSFKIKSRRFIATIVVEAILLEAACGTTDPFAAVRARVGGGTVRVGLDDWEVAEVVDPFNDEG